MIRWEGPSRGSKLLQSSCLFIAHWYLEKVQLFGTAFPRKTPCESVTAHQSRANWAARNVPPLCCKTEPPNLRKKTKLSFSRKEQKSNLWRRLRVNLVSAIEVQQEIFLVTAWPSWVIFVRKCWAALGALGETFRRSKAAVVAEVVIWRCLR
jgi:hypothetical protein